MNNSLNGRCDSVGWLALRCGMVIVVASLPLSIALMNIGLAIAWAGALVARAPIHRTVGFWWGVAYAAWQFVSMLVAGWEGREFGGGIGSTYTWTGLCLAQVAFRGNDPGAVRARTWAMAGLGMTTAASVAVALGQLLIGRQPSAKPFRIHPEGVRFERGTGFFAIHLTYGVVMMFVFLAAFGGSFRSWTPWRLWRPSVEVLSIIGLVVSFARLSFVGLAVGVTVFIASGGRRALVRAAAVGLGLLLLGGTILAIVHPDRLERMLRLEDGRWPIWRTSWAIVMDYPVVGAGSSAAYRAEYRERYAKVNPGQWNEFPGGAPHAHHAQLALVAVHGIPAVLLWAALVVATLIALGRRRDSNPAAWRTGVALMTAFMSAGQFENLARDGESCHALWTLMGCCLASASHHEQP